MLQTLPPSSPLPCLFFSPGRISDGEHEELGGGYQSRRWLLSDFKPGGPRLPARPPVRQPQSWHQRGRKPHAGGEIFDLSSLEGSTATQKTGAVLSGGGTFTLQKYEIII